MWAGQGGGGGCNRHQQLLTVCHCQQDHSTITSETIAPSPKAAAPSPKTTAPPWSAMILFPQAAQAHPPGTAICTVFLPLCFLGPYPFWTQWSNWSYATAITVLVKAEKRDLFCSYIDGGRTVFTVSVNLFFCVLPCDCKYLLSVKAYYLKGIICGLNVPAVFSQRVLCDMNVSFTWSTVGTFCECGGISHALQIDTLFIQSFRS